MHINLPKKVLLSLNININQILCEDSIAIHDLENSDLDCTGKEKQSAQPHFSSSITKFSPDLCCKENCTF